MTTTITYCRDKYGKDQCSVAVQLIAEACGELVRTLEPDFKFKSEGDEFLEAVDFIDINAAKLSKATLLTAKSELLREIGRMM